MSQPDVLDLLRKIDAVVRRRALVYGSLPPHGRDLDLLVVPDDAAAIAARLHEEGYTAWGRAWVSFGGCSATLVELIPAATLGVPRRELEALFEEASPLVPFTSIVEPASHHSLLILARRLAHGPARLLPKHRARIDHVLARDPAAWEQARSRAGLWAAGPALERLESLHAQADAPLRRHGRLLLRRPRRTRLIALSGVDPERQRSHAEFLRGTLDRLGFDSLVERPAFPRVRGRQRVFAGWRAFLAVRCALSLWRPVWRHLGRGKVLIYEHSALDFAVSLAGNGMKAGKPPPAVQVLRILSPNPLRSYLLDVAERGVPAWRADAYRYGSTAFGFRRLDTGQAREALCEEIASDAWRALTRRAPFASAIRSMRAGVRRLHGVEAEPPSA